MAIDDLAFVVIFVIAVILLITYCCGKSSENGPNIPVVPNATPVIRHTVFILQVEDETSKNLVKNQEKTAKMNKIPQEYSNIKPEATVSGWKQGAGVSGIPPDAKIPQNSQPPTISDDD